MKKVRRNKLGPRGHRTEWAKRKSKGTRKGNLLGNQRFTSQQVVKHPTRGRITPVSKPIGGANKGEIAQSMWEPRQPMLKSSSVRNAIR